MSEKELPAHGPCVACGKNPAEGFASVRTQESGEQWLCHGDNSYAPTCYDQHQWSVAVGLPLCAAIDCLITGCRWGDPASSGCECA